MRPAMRLPAITPGRRQANAWLADVDRRERPAGRGDENAPGGRRSGAPRRRRAPRPTPRTGGGHRRRPRWRAARRRRSCRPTRRVPSRGRGPCRVGSSNRTRPDVAGHPERLVERGARLPVALAHQDDGHPLVAERDVERRLVDPGHLGQAAGGGVEGDRVDDLAGRRRHERDAAGLGDRDRAAGASSRSPRAGRRRSPPRAWPRSSSGTAARTTTCAPSPVEAASRRSYSAESPPVMAASASAAAAGSGTAVGSAVSPLAMPPSARSATPSKRVRASSLPVPGSTRTTSPSAVATAIPVPSSVSPIRVIGAPTEASSAGPGPASSTEVEPAVRRPSSSALVSSARIAPDRSRRSGDAPSGRGRASRPRGPPSRRPGAATRGRRRGSGRRSRRRTGPPPGRSAGPDPPSGARRGRRGPPCRARARAVTRSSPATISPTAIAYFARWGWVYS